MTTSHLEATLRGTTTFVGRMSAYEFGETDSVQPRQEAYAGRGNGKERRTLREAGYSVCCSFSGWFSGAREKGKKASGLAFIYTLLAHCVGILCRNRH